jgi:hypothetical protein
MIYSVALVFSWRRRQRDRLRNLFDLLTTSRALCGAHEAKFLCIRNKTRRQNPVFPAAKPWQIRSMSSKIRYGRPRQAAAF